jgi:hypothetical protein
LVKRLDHGVAEGVPGSQNVAASMCTDPATFPEVRGDPELKMFAAAPPDPAEAVQLDEVFDLRACPAGDDPPECPVGMGAGLHLELAAHAVAVDSMLTTATVL